LHPERSVSPFEITLRDLLASGHDARFRASGDSMHPVIRGGDYLHVVPCNPSELRRGEVVLAKTDRGLTAHRIVRIAERGGTLRIVMRGDNALRSDAPISAADVLGRIARVEGDMNIRNSAGEWARIIRFTAVLARRLRSRFHQ
jgi:signal peptidase I